MADGEAKKKYDEGSAHLRFHRVLHEEGKDENDLHTHKKLVAPGAFVEKRIERGSQKP